MNPTAIPTLDSIAPPRCRPFTLADAMVLVAAGALWSCEMSMVIGVADGLRFLVFPGCLAALTMLSLAYLVIRLRRPHPPLSEVSRQPGLLLVPLVILANLAAGLLAMLSHTFMNWTAPAVGINLTAPAVGVVFLFVWAGAADSGRLRPEPGWIERLGNGVTHGWLWLTLLGLPLWSYLPL